MPLFGHNTTTRHPTGRVHGSTATSGPVGHTPHRHEDHAGLTRDTNYGPNDRYHHGDHGLAAERRHDEDYDRYMPGEYGRAGAGAAGMPGHGTTADQYRGHPDLQNDTTTGRYNQPGYNTTGPGPHTGLTGSTADAGYGGAAHHAGTGMGTTAGTTTFTNPALREAKRLERKGQLEHAVGTILSSQSMKTKGAMKEEQGHRLKVQAEEIARAERLERQAQLSRDRAHVAGQVPRGTTGGANVIGGVGGPVGSI